MAITRSTSYTVFLLLPGMIHSICFRSSSTRTKSARVSLIWLFSLYIALAFTAGIAGMIINSQNTAFAIADTAPNKSRTTPFFRSSLLGRSSSVTAKTTGGNFKTTNGESDNGDTSFSISLWLLPSPTDTARKELSNMITTFSERHPGASVPFQPHVTLVGGTKCPSMKFLEERLLPRLREGIQKTNPSIGSGIPCHFEPEPVFKDQWNQACVLVMEESLAFTELVELCREIMAIALADNLSADDLPRDHFPPPLHKPHMSLYYGTEGVPSPDEIRQNLYGDDNPSSSSQSAPHYSFQASQVAVWKTDPASTEGVAQWEELAVIDLPERVKV